MAGLVNVKLDYKTVVAVGAVALGLYLFAKHEATKTAVEAVDYIASGEMGESAFDLTHDVNNNPTPIGKELDWLAGIKKGVDY